MMKKEDYISVPRLAEILGVSRIAVYKRVKKGQIKAVKVGKNYAIPRSVVAGILGTTLSKGEKQRIDRAIRKTVEEYGEVLIKLGNA